MIINMCIRPWQGRLVHFEKKLPGANVVGSQPIGVLGDLDFPLAIDPHRKGSKPVQIGPTRYKRCNLCFFETLLADERVK